MKNMTTKGAIGAMAAGVVIGAVVGMMVDPLNDKQHKKICKNASNVFKTIGAIVDDVISM
jgi:gas vesicle protein